MECCRNDLTWILKYSTCRQMLGLRFMSSKKREKLLTTLFAAALLGWGGLTCFDSWSASDSDGNESLAVSLQKETVSLHNEAALVDHSLRGLRSLQDRSLPADPGQAASLYQAWLMTRLDDSGLQNVTVTPVPPIAEENLGHRILASIEATGTETAVARFVDSFSATPLLHRISSLDVAPFGADDQGTMRVSLSVEALSLKGVARNELPPPATNRDATLEALLTSHSVFAEPVAQSVSVTEMPAPASDMVADVATSVQEPSAETPSPALRFVAAVQRGDNREAWFVETVSGESQRCGNSSRLALGNIEVSVVRVDQEEAILHNGTREFRVKLGDLVPEQFLQNPIPPSSHTSL